MAEIYTLDVQNRHVKGKQVRQLRRVDLIPAVIYGAGNASVQLSCPRRPLELLLAKAGGTHLVKLNVDGNVENVLVRDVQRDPIRRDLIHIDFLRVDLSKKLRTEVPITFVGEPKMGNESVLATYINQLLVECLPTDIPDHIIVDVGNMRLYGDHVTVGDLPKYENVTYLADVSDVIVRVELTANATADDLSEGGTPEPEIASAKGKKVEEA